MGKYKETVDNIIERHNIKMKQLKDSDLISGKTYRKLIEDFKAYDKRRKDYCKELEGKLNESNREKKEYRSKVSFLEMEIQHLNREIKSLKEKLKEKETPEDE